MVGQFGCCVTLTTIDGTGSKEAWRSERRASCPATRFPPVEAEGEFVQVIVQVLQAYRSLVRAHQPPLEEGDHPMNSRHQFRWSLLLSLQKEPHSRSSADRAHPLLLDDAAHRNLHKGGPPQAHDRRIRTTEPGHLPEPQHNQAASGVAAKLPRVRPGTSRLPRLSRSGDPAGRPGAAISSHVSGVLRPSIR